MAVDDTFFFERMLILSQCLCQELENAGLPKPCFCGILTGSDVAADYCSCDSVKACGMAWVRLVEVHPIELLATAGASPRQPCMPPLEATVEVGVLRCAPMPDDQGNMPDPQKMLLHAQMTYADMAASLKAITCDCTGFPRGDLLVDSWNPVSEAGGCSGGTWLVTLAQNYG